MSKLIAVADVIKDSLETIYKIPAAYKLEIKKDWLYNVPNKALYRSFWDELSYVYEEIVNNRWSLDDIFLQYNNILKYNSKGIVDIWFEEPYNFICEFDEIQHFNQYRLITLEKGYKNLNISFNYNEYYRKCSERTVEPNVSGFHKLRTNDPFFPEIYDGYNQDNRIRQRAYRDFLKDIIPVKLGYNPTVRIGSFVTNNHINNFTNQDLSNVKRYLTENNILNNILLK